VQTSKEPSGNQGTARRKRPRRPRHLWHDKPAADMAWHAPLLHPVLYTLTPTHTLFFTPSHPLTPTNYYTPQPLRYTPAGRRPQARHTAPYSLQPAACSPQPKAQGNMATAAESPPRIRRASHSLFNPVYINVPFLPPFSPPAPPSVVTSRTYCGGVQLTPMATSRCAPLAR